MWPGQLLSFIPDLIMRKVGTYESSRYWLPSFIRKPLYECMICMASVWTAVFWFAAGNHLRPCLLMAMLIVCGINVIICAFLERNTDYGC